MARQNKAEIILTARDRTKSAFASVNKGLGRMATIGLAGAAAGTILLTRAALQQIDILAKTSVKLGITTEALQGLRLAAEKSGVPIKQLDMGIQRMTRRIAEAAAGSGEAKAALLELGLSAVELAQKSPDEQMKDLADAFENVTGQSNKVRLGFKLFDSEGVALINTLEGGRAALDAAAEATERFGTNISAVDAASVEDANDAFTDLREAVKGVGFDLARRFAPGMEAASISAAGFVVTIRREFIPAMALLLEQLDLVVANVRGLSDIELAVRVEVQTEKVAALEEDLKNALTPAKELFNVFGAPVTFKAPIDAEAIEFEKAAAEARLTEVRIEQDRRAAIILEADRKLEETRAAQKVQAQEAVFAAERETELEHFEERLERDKERTSEFIRLKLKEAKELRKILFAEARENQRALEAQGRLEERAAQNTIFLRQATMQTSVQILQVLVGKNKTVAQALFLVEKGLAIARTVQNTSAAAVKALAELGPIAGPPAAAAIQSFGAAQVGLIAATTLTGISSVGGGFGGFGGGGFATEGGFADTSPVEAPPSGGAAVPEQGVVQLIFPSLFGITPEAIDALADALREASENRDVIIVSGQGRNAELLAGANG